MKTLIVLLSFSAVVFGSSVRVFNPDEALSDHVKVAEHDIEDSLKLKGILPLPNHKLIGNFGLVQPKDVSVLGFLKDVAIPAAEARRKAELESLKSQRIVGGAPVEAGKVPWQAALLIEIIGSNGLGVCGASLVSSNRLVTAAHCWTDGINQAWRYTVVLGSLALFTGNDGIRQQTSVVVTHPNWTPILLLNDIAVVYIPESVASSDTIAPVSLPSNSEATNTFAGFTAYASGFGVTSDGGSIPADQPLSQATLEVITNAVCWWSFPFFVHDSHICTSGEEGRSPCNGDSGGPLVTVSDNRTVLIGVVSFGSAQGCQKGYPAVYTRVTSFLDFIEENLE